MGMVEMDMEELDMVEYFSEGNIFQSGIFFRAEYVFRDEYFSGVNIFQE